MSMYGRLSWLAPEDLSPEQRDLYDKIVGGPRARNRATPLLDEQGRLYGPFNALLTNPGIGDAVQALGASLRFAGTIPRPLFELVVLVVARERGASYEWYAHKAIARSRGVTDDQIAAVHEGKAPVLADRESASALLLAGACLRHEEVPVDVMRDVEAAYGSAGVTEIVATVGFYDLVATLMRTWESPLPEGVSDPLA